MRLGVYQLRPHCPGADSEGANMINVTAANRHCCVLPTALALHNPVSLREPSAAEGHQRTFRFDPVTLRRSPRIRESQIKI
ncbi:hypothetical protein EVAR_44645_1 [Eumeta japonica]|uniref:Uncharacterized protein n=1 Tax=Eumeta variegata TaxID=151549 RepID=A0A4C1XIZ0_EUMVA|nr:hypothetical protein EVAR_44645_1 [Eumeta japonica]